MFCKAFSLAVRSLVGLTLFALPSLSHADTQQIANVSWSGTSIANVTLLADVETYVDQSGNYVDQSFGFSGTDWIAWDAGFLTSVVVDQSGHNGTVQGYVTFVDSTGTSWPALATTALSTHAHTSSIGLTIELVDPNTFQPFQPSVILYDSNGQQPVLVGGTFISK